MSRVNLDQAAARTLGDRYQLVSRIGSGASAEVYQATDLRLGRNVAVKQLRSDLSDDARFAKLFRSEAYLAAQLSHPNILTVFDWSADPDGVDGGAYIVTELLSGGSLRTILDNEGTISVSQAALTGVQTAKGLAAAHEQGLVHRDIKPANLLFGADGRIHIGDFGIARAVAQAAWTEPEGVLIGTARYAAPEQAEAESIDGLVDVYSLAVCLIEALTGEVPLAGETSLATMMKRQRQDLPVDETFGPLAEPLAHAGAADPSKRATAAQFSAALADACRLLPKPEPLMLIDLTEHVGGPVAVGPHLVTARQGEDRFDEQDQPGAQDLPVDRQTLDEFEHQDYDGPEVAPGLVPKNDPEIVPKNDQKNGQEIGNGVDERIGQGSHLDGEVELRRPRRKGRWVFAVLVFACLAVGALFAGRLIGEARQPELERISVGLPSFPVEDYGPLSAAEVQTIANANQWTLTVTEQFADNTEVGQILSQVPEPGRALGLGGQVELVTSLGPVRRLVPETVGLPLQEATELVEAANLTVGAVSDRYDEAIGADTVLEASIDGVAAQPGSEFVTGTAIDLVVSAGPAPRQVPPLVGLTVEQAKVAVVESGLAFATTEEYSNSVAEGLVIAASPDAGAMIPRGATVTARVSLGLPFVNVPDVTGKPVPEAIDILKGQGFTVRINGTIGSSVIGTRPQANQSVRSGTEVEILSAN